ncbi:hypothetical protein [Thermobifida fusca]|uniref:hypothetical protein n=1 Tax=Thermobifida fusca TaxID=2021 RepID=UPI00241DA508|nr:hypothetical protein [Thermobifida fusca]
MHCAHQALHAAGYQTRVITADGAGGFPALAPYDRIIATCAVWEVPRAWLTQVRDGVAEGRFLQELAFMWLRSQRWSGGPPHDLGAQPESVRQTEGGQDLLADDGSLLPLMLMVPHWRYGLRNSEHGLVMWLSATASPSWARVYSDRVEQGGPRRLWEELEQAYAWWVQRGRPEVSQFGLTVGPRSHVVWLESPDGPSCHH